ncbi:MAG: hypothetical protein WAV51_00195 [Microgenomates group bacterium]
MKTYSVADVELLIHRLSASNHATTDTGILNKLKQAFQQDPPLVLPNYQKQKLATLLFALLGSPSHSGYVAKYRLAAVELLGFIGDKSVRNVLAERLKVEWFDSITNILRTAIEAIDQRLKK